MERTLNISEPQVLFHCPADPNGLEYHHRVLVHKIGQGRWVVLSPDLELSVEDLTQQRHVVLSRHSPFPAHLLPVCYIFDELSKNELERQKRLARTMGSILDDSEVVGIAATGWVVADPSSDRFGHILPHELVEDVLTLGSYGLCEWDGVTEYLKEIVLDDLQTFKESKKDAYGDLRTLGDHRDSHGRRHLPFNEAVDLLRESKFEDWTFNGPRAVMEYLKAVVSGPGDLTTYHLTWIRSSGVQSGTAVVHEHKSLCECLRLALMRDQLDVSNLMSFEHLTRRLIILEMAVARSPASPDFSGLDLVAEAPISSAGAAQVASMNTWITERLKERANIQKQARLYREETGRKGNKAGHDDDNDAGKRWRGKRGKQSKGSGGGGGDAPAAGK